ncbi:hypothetical protein, partial [Microbacterium sp. BF1]|uniref:hypothetical protein n=1 Tax=Microbacterium sp. BF1 TaxID=2821146 RepID=UPI001C4E06C5
NAVEAVATPPTGPLLSETTSVAVPIAPAPALQLTKTGAVLDGGAGEAGDVIRFAFVFQNTGCAPGHLGRRRAAPRARTRAVDPARPVLGHSGRGDRRGARTAVDGDARPRARDRRT